MDIWLTISVFGASAALSVLTLVVFNLFTAVPGEDRT